MSAPFDDFFAEQALRPKQQENKGDHISEPALDAAAQERAPVELAELLAHPDDDAADDSARNRGETTEHEHRQGFERDDLEREGDVGTRAPHDAGGERHDAGREPHDDPNLFERNSDRKRRLVTIGDRPQGAPDPRALEEHREAGHHQGRNDGGRDLALLQRHRAAQYLEIECPAGEKNFALNHTLGPPPYPTLPEPHP